MAAQLVTDRAWNGLSPRLWLCRHLGLPLMEDFSLSEVGQRPGAAQLPWAGGSPRGGSSVALWK